MYALHALAGFIGITSGATVIGAFVFGLPSILAVSMNYARRDRVRGSWLESHFLWQIRTSGPRWSWVALFASRWCWARSAWSAWLRRRSPVPSVPWGRRGIWGAGSQDAGRHSRGRLILYRVARGWLALRGRRCMADKTALWPSRCWWRARSRPVARKARSIYLRRRPSSHAPAATPPSSENTEAPNSPQSPDSPPAPTSPAPEVTAPEETPPADHPDAPKKDKKSAPPPPK